MGVYIKGMEMPTEGYIDVRIKCNGTASFAIADNPYFKAVEAIPVPPHGRLIDADTLTRRILEEHDKFEAMNQYDSGLRAGYRASAKAVRLAPTIIPAEEGE